jgi:hypothetical protein
MDESLDPQSPFAPTEGQEAPQPSEQPVEAGPEQQPEPPETAPEPERNRYQEITHENRQLRDLLAQAQQALVQQNQQPRQAPPQQPDPFQDPNLTPEWRETLGFLRQRFDPMIEERVNRAVAPLVPRLINSEIQNERLALQQRSQFDERYGDFAGYEQEAMQARMALLQQGVNIPLEAVFFYLKGMRGGSAPATERKVQQAVKRTRAAVNASVETAAPAGTRQPGQLTEEAVRAMKDPKDLQAILEKHNVRF